MSPKVVKPIATFGRCALVLLILTSSATSRAENSSDPNAIIAVVAEGRPCVTIPYRPGLTVLKAIARARIHFSARRRILYLFRAGRGLRLDLAAIMAGRAENIALGPWDIIVVGHPVRPNE